MTSHIAHPAPAVDDQSGPGRWTRVLARACDMLVVVDGMHAADRLWHQVPAFRYQEEDDWRLVGADLQQAMAKPLAENNQLRDQLRERFRVQAESANLDDPGVRHSIAVIADLLTEAEMYNRSGQPAASGKTPPSERVRVAYLARKKR